jgi:hypothetical protein
VKNNIHVIKTHNGLIVSGVLKDFLKKGDLYLTETNSRLSVDEKYVKYVKIHQVRK